MFQKYADVALKLPLNTLFTYRLPPEMEELQPGRRVNVIFNRRPMEGVIRRVHENEPEYEVLDVLGEIDPEPVLSPGQIELGAWMAEYYLAGIGECLFKMFPRVPKRFPKRGEKSVDAPPRPRHDLNDEQRAVYEDVRRGAEEIERSPAGTKPYVHLVHGVTGSGKTEIYIHLLLDALERGKSGILLVPEISLTVQLIERLREVFGERLALLHSALKASERFRSYIALLRGEKKIAVGTRSAVFAPTGDLGVIILDEEHDSSYKEHGAPRYHARQIAYRLAETRGASLVMGSATPSLESRYFAENGGERFRLHRLRKRATGASMPDVRLVAVREPEIPVSGHLLNEIEANLKEGRQTLLLLNRRGYFPFLYCRKCEASLVCPRCSVTLKLHSDGRLICHYCEFSRKNDGLCDRCGAKTEPLGSGTQKLEEYLLRLFPAIRLERLDTDTATRSGSIQDSIGRLLAGQIDLLLGTQMIAKGLDAPNVTLVGVLQADLGLSMPDFRAQERIFSLLTQVAGRAGRGEHRGRVVFEVFNTENRVIQLAREQDYETFYRGEIENRREAFYPPFCRITRLLYRSESESRAKTAAESLAAILERVFRDASGPRPLVLGPAAAPLSRLHNQFRFHLLIKSAAVGELRKLLRASLKEIRGTLKGDLYLEIDFDPLDLL